MGERSRFMRTVLFAVGYPAAVYYVFLYLRPSRIVAAPFLLWPVFVSLFLLGLFASSLRCGPSMVEQFARRSEGTIPPEAAEYCRKVTVAWCVFFLANATTAAVTVFCAPLWVWTLYNGCLSYVAVGMLFVGEYLYRMRWKRTLGRDAA